MLSNPFVGRVDVEIARLDAGNDRDEGFAREQSRDCWRVGRQIGDHLVRYQLGRIVERLNSPLDTRFFVFQGQGVHRLFKIGPRAARVVAKLVETHHRLGCGPVCRYLGGVSHENQPRENFHRRVYRLRLGGQTSSRVERRDKTLMGRGPRQVPRPHKTDRGPSSVMQSTFSGRGTRPKSLVVIFGPAKLEKRTLGSVAWHLHILHSSLVRWWRLAVTGGEGLCDVGRDCARSRDGV